MSRVAVVTGGNKGIGFAIVRGLCKDFDGDVYLTARDVTRGQEAIKELEKEGLHPKFHQLDIDSKDSIEALKTFIQEKYGGLDVLVNNAGMAFKPDSTTPLPEQAEITCHINFWGTLNVSKLLLPIMKSHARIVNIASMLAEVAFQECSQELQKKIKNVSTIEEIENFMQQYVDDFKSGHHVANGWSSGIYPMSKVGVCAMTPLQQKVLDQDISRQDVVINSCCPGFVDTDLTNHLTNNKYNAGKLTPNQGAETPLYLALLPQDVKTPRGEYVKLTKIEQWC